MASISRYVLVDREDHEQDYEFEDFDEAVEAAGDTHAVVERQYEYADSELVWTPDGGDQWPPKPEGPTRTK